MNYDDDRGKIQGDDFKEQPATIRPHPTQEWITPLTSRHSFACRRRHHFTGTSPPDAVLAR
jgi:hypothetical protein